jgi:HAD superfamily hydrolase (TIGR01509 family)
MRLRGVIFDVDGTLVDSNDAHAHAWVKALHEAGHGVPFSRVRPLIGMGGDKLLPAAAGIRADSEEGVSIASRRGAIFRGEFLPQLQAFPGARELLGTLKVYGFGLAVASSAEKRELIPLLRLAGGHDLVEHKASGDDVEESKPDPDIIGVALKRLRCPPEEAIMVGDTPYDIEAARRAGCACIAFRCGGWPDERLSGAVAIYDGPRDLLERLHTFPLTTTPATAAPALR